jgi:hypothetical protein
MHRRCPIFGLCKAQAIRREHHDFTHKDISPNKDVE